jgi:hypothetical protein
VNVLDSFDLSGKLAVTGEVAAPFRREQQRYQPPACGPDRERARAKPSDRRLLARLGVRG